MSPARSLHVIVRRVPPRRNRSRHDSGVRAVAGATFAEVATSIAVNYCHKNVPAPLAAAIARLPCMTVLGTSSLGFIPFPRSVFVRSGGRGTLTAALATLRMRPPGGYPGGRSVVSSLCGWPSGVDGLRVGRRLGGASG
jgi:hypothetical protein